jgi:hypothetical protein
VTTQGLKSWILIMAVLVLTLVYLSVTSDGTVSWSFGPAGLISGGLLVLAAYNWGGWKRN